MDSQIIFSITSLLLLSYAETFSIDRENGVVEEIQLLPNVQYGRRGEKVCMRDLGCFVLTDDFFHPVYRPFNFLPNDRLTINTRFQLFTKRNPKEHWDIEASNSETIRKSPIDPTLKTKFIIHGFIDNKFYSKWMESLKDNLLLHNDYNIFIVDWSGGNSPPYSQAASNTRVVGAEIAHLIQVLQRVKNVSTTNCHLIGHSLGAHAAGYAGKLLNKLGRISGVDPAEPFFQNMPQTVRIDKGDANFVDIIHTDGSSILLFGLGMSQAVGHIDFYPNGGKSQPGCKTDVVRSIFLEGLLDATRRFVACNHQRAVDFFTYSINYHKAPPVAYQCPSWEAYLEGNCADCGKSNKRCAIMGLRADEYEVPKNNTESIRLYLSTSGTAPYWVYHYQVTLKLYKPKKKFQDQEGKVTIILHGEYDSWKTDLNPTSITLYHGSTYKFLVTTGKEIGEVHSVTLSWHSSSWNIFKSKAIHIDYVKVSMLNIIDKKEQQKYDKIFQDKRDNEIKPGVSVSLLEKTLAQIL